MANKSFIGGSSTASLPPNEELRRQIEREVEETRRREEQERTRRKDNEKADQEQRSA